jgi:hypothetical protein
VNDRRVRWLLVALVVQLHGHVPYRDFGLEYPPLAPLAFLLPGLVPHGWAPSVLALQAVALEASVGWLLWRRCGRDAFLRYAVLSLLLFPFLSGGFDAVPMAAIAWSTALLADGDRRGWWVAAVGTLAKLSPGAAWAWARTRPRTAIVALVVTGALALVPALLATSPDDSYLGYSAHRGTQVESVAATTGWLVAKLTGTTVGFAYRFRSWQVVGGPGWTVPLWAGLAVLGLALLALRARRVDPWLAAFTAVVLLLVGNKVLSPQFVTWAAPLAAVLGGRWWKGWLAVAGLTVAAYAAADGGTSAFVGLCLLRNAVLVGVGVLALKQLLDPRPQRVELPVEVRE